ncbi:MAG TPA: xylulokinase [Ktedonobacterales bacterium]|nr:xylulokinase [Ktedonobacterales bacterium]
MPRTARSTTTPLYLGLDIGTSSVKALAVTPAGTVLGVASAAHPLRQPRPGWVEQQPDDWWAAACAALRAVLARPGVAGTPVAALGLSGQMHGATLLDGAGQPLRPSLIWADGRAIPTLSPFLARLRPADLLAITGSLPYASATLAKLLWVRDHEPAIWARLVHVLLAKDSVRRRLTGTIATDHSDASATQLYDVSARAWSSAIRDALGLAASALPEIRAADTIAGAVTNAAAEATGLLAGTPVATGGGDAECAAFGARLGEAAAGDVLVSLGTAGQVFALLDAPTIDPTGGAQTLAYVAGTRWHTLGAILAAGHTLAWLAAVAGAEVATLLAEASAVAPGANGLLCIPSLLGARGATAGGARAAFLGLTAAHRRAHLARAAVEGVAFALRERLEAMREMGVAAERVLLAGAPAATALWPRVLADVLALPVVPVPVAHASALGAARLAARALGDELAPAPDAPCVTLPVSAHVTTYERRYPLYRATDAALGALHYR